MQLIMGENVFNHHTDWELSDSGIWKGKNNRYYRLGKDNQVYISSDLRDWERHYESIWRDINSRWIKLVDGKLYSSTDKLNWTALKEPFWTSPSGILYKFDDELKLYTKGSSKLYGLIEMQN